MGPATVDELIGCVLRSFWDQKIETTENIFLTLQQCMECVMLSGGGNKYQLPHMGKSKLRNKVEHMPLTIECSQEAVDMALEVIHDA